MNVSESFTSKLESIGEYAENSICEYITKYWLKAICHVDVVDWAGDIKNFNYQIEMELRQ